MGPSTSRDFSSSSDWLKCATKVLSKLPSVDKKNQNSRKISFDTCLKTARYIAKGIRGRE